MAGPRLSVDGHVFFPHSLGLLYLAVTQYLGFPNYGDEFKVMGLAPYGEPKYVHEIESLLRLEDNGGFELDLSYFRHWSEGVQMTWEMANWARIYAGWSRCSVRALREEPVAAKHKPSPPRCRSSTNERRCVLRHVRAAGSTKLCSLEAAR